MPNRAPVQRAPKHEGVGGGGEAAEEDDCDVLLLDAAAREPPLHEGSTVAAAVDKDIHEYVSHSDFVHPRAGSAPQ